MTGPDAGRVDERAGQLRVLQVHAGYRTPAGEDTVVIGEARALRRAGHLVEQSIEHNPQDTITAVRRLGRSLYNRSTASRVRSMCDEFDPDVVHVHNTWFAQSSSVLDAAATAGRPLVMTLHNYRLGCLSTDLFRDNDVCTACIGRSPLAGVAHGCYRDSRVLSALAAAEVITTRRRGAFAHVDQFIAPSHFMGDRLIDMGVPADRLIVKPHFTDDPGPRVIAPSEADDVLFIGRLASAKGIRTLLRAWERHVSRLDQVQRRQARLTVIGDGPLMSEARESAPRTVNFTGWLTHDAVLERMLSARAFVFPSEWYEPFGMVIIEALAAGLPVVTATASDAARIAGSPPELIAPPGNDEALSKCFDHLTDEAVDEVGRASRARFESTYEPSKGAEKLASIYRDMIDRTRDAGR